MNYETKRDVLVNAVDALADAQASSDNNVGLGHQDADLFMAEYEKALPDDLPVIPKAIGEYITSCKARMMDLHDSMFNWLRSEEEDEFMDCYSKIFASAWVLGAWRVEETSEIVKLEVDE